MNMKRMRGRNHRPNSGGGGGTGGGFRNQQNGIPLNRNHVFDSSGPEMRVRGTAQQLYEKYQQMARDASSNGDRVTGEAYYQHAEHYFRIIAAINQAQGQPNQPAQQNGGQSQERGNYQPQQNGGQNQERGEYQRRDYNNNGNSAEHQGESQNEPRQDTRPQEQRPQENRQQEQQPRPQQEPRRHEQRTYEPRQPKPEFSRQERNFRPEPVVDARIDISSALEAELAAAAIPEPAGFGEQPVIQTPAPAPVPEPKAIPIIPEAPPALELVAPRVPRPRGRPRLVKPEVEKTGE
jgi:hypothetical protein